MRTFFDPIENEDINIHHGAIFYLVKAYVDPDNPMSNTYYIQGLSSTPDKLAQDPLTRAQEYYPLDKEKITHNPLQAALFPDNKLTREAMSAEKIATFFQFDPNQATFNQFNQTMRQELRLFWETNLPRQATGRLRINYASTAQLTELAILSQNLFTEEDTEGYLENIILCLIDFCKRFPALRELKEHGFTSNHLLTLAFDHTDLRELFTPESMQALHDQTLTPDDFLAISSRQRRLLLIHPECINALKLKHTCVKELRKLSLEAFQEAIADNHFPPASSSPGLSR